MTYVILIEHPETGARKFCWISVREELFINS